MTGQEVLINFLAFAHQALTQTLASCEVSRIAHKHHPVECAAYVYDGCVHFPAMRSAKNERSRSPACLPAWVCHVVLFIISLLLCAHDECIDI
jgi:hypothetical protein